MAGSVNKVILVGNLGKDPEIRRTQDGRPIANLSIATSETWRDKGTGERKEKTEWHRVVIFSEPLCKIVEQYLKKGAKVYIEGALQTRKWTDQSGVEKYSTEVVLQGFNSTLTMLDGRSGGGGGSFGSDDSAAISAPAVRSAPRRAAPRWPAAAAAATATWTTIFRSRAGLFVPRQSLRPAHWLRQKFAFAEAGVDACSWADMPAQEPALFNEQTVCNPRAARAIRARRCVLNIYLRSFA